MGSDVKIAQDKGLYEISGNLNDSRRRWLIIGSVKNSYIMCPFLKFWQDLTKVESQAEQEHILCDHILSQLISPTRHDPHVTCTTSAAQGLIKHRVTRLGPIVPNVKQHSDDLESGFSIVYFDFSLGFGQID